MATQIVASRMYLMMYKQKILGAKKGYDLLKKKCDALKARFRQIMVELLATKKGLGESSTECFLMMATSQWAAGDFHQQVRDGVKRASIRLEMGAENVAGVYMPKFTLKVQDDADSNLNQIGLYGGAQSIQKTREKFRELLKVIVKIASLQSSFLTLDEVIKVTNRRVNALEYVVIPRFVSIVKYINQELDEQAREEKFTAKKVLDNKKKFEAEELRLKGELIASGKRDETGDESVFGETKDEDVLF